ncbi:hypothetical protein GJ744_004809 [Endocarpon pusillum]|uniref:CHAT domain-containing protein n=1 Tax=Endocarpon pusillum TaxID=364733 RepID=A0A8H7DZX4_9EURO|nr:hypothetical protein GJ744_004809 [Endocarpon pusillum]
MEYQRTEVMTDLEIAIQRLQETLDTTPADHPERARRLLDLGIGYGDRYQRTGAVTDLGIAIQRFQEGLDMTPADHPERASRLQALGIGYRDRYLRTGAMTDLEIAIQRLQEALDTTPVDHPDRALRLQDLGIGYRDRYLRTGAVTDFEIAIQRHQEALDMTPVDHPDRALRLQDLGTGYRDRYQKAGAITDLEIAIQRHQEALDMTPADHPERALRLQALGLGYGDRYQRTGAVTDLGIAIQRFQEGLDMTPADHPERASQLQALGIGYRDRYQRTGAMTDLEIAIQRLQEALDTTPADHPDRALRLQDLGTGYGDRYQETGAMTDLEIAIQRFQEALDTTPADHPERARRLQALGIGYKDRYQRTGAMTDLGIAIQRYQEGLDTTPADHPERARRLLDLGIGYRDRYQRTGAVTDLEIAIQRYQEALDHSSSFINNRLRSGRLLLTLHAQAGNWPQAYQAASKTVSLVPLLTPRSLETSDKQHLLREVVDLASDASAITLSAAKTPFDAVQALELGRGVIAGSLNEVRADISDLQQKHPQLVEEYITLRGQLDAPTTSMQRQVDQRYNASQKLERMIQQIRRLPDFDRFLLAPSEDELKAAAQGGPVVIINVSDYRCDALIIEKTQIRALRLPHLHTSDIRDRTTGSLTEPEILEWLWKTIAQPVLHMLRFTITPSDGCWPHIWWIPTGPLAKFPIHAAGCHSRSPSDNVIDRVISSYSSSVRTIMHGRDYRSQTIRMPRSEEIILVAMQKTPEQSDLQSATQEIEELEGLCSSMNLQVRKPSPYKEQVLSALNSCKIFHFAGHGLTDPSDPSKSQLLLADWKTEPLTVASLMETNLRKQMPFLAYLSACGTGQIKHDELIDEGLHLISACQLAGFQHVIGTLWEVNDKSCVDMAITTYKWMRDHGMSDESVSEGLHHASKYLRRQWIEENSARGALKRGKGVQTTRDGQMALERSYSGQGEGRDPRDVELYDDTELSPPYWVPYVHFGV